MYNIFVGNVLHLPTSKLYTLIGTRKFSLKTDPLFEFEWLKLRPNTGTMPSIDPPSEQWRHGSPRQPLFAWIGPSAHVHTDVLFETHFRDKIYFWILHFSCHVIGWRLEIVCLINNSLFNLITTIIIIPVYWQLYLYNILFLIQDNIGVSYIYIKLRKRIMYRK